MYLITKVWTFEHINKLTLFSVVKDNKPKKHQSNFSVLF